MPNLLLDLELAEISVVPKGAQPGAVIGLVKTADPLAALMADARALVSKGEAGEAVRMAKSGVPAPGTYWRAALAELTKQHRDRAPGIDVGMAGLLALSTEDGKALLAALARATE